MISAARTWLFQFHKGTIKTLLMVVKTLFLLLNFNSIKVRLKLRHQEDVPRHYAYFNSIKVRLKPCSSRKHNLLQKFQFHKGTIKTSNCHCGLVFLSNFNSIKVRLKHKMVLSSIKTILFQFHKGTIKTRLMRKTFRNKWISIP